MSKQERTIATQVQASGLAEADYDTTQFSLGAIATGKTQAQAKENLRQAINAYGVLLKALADDGVKIDEASKRSSVSTSPRWSQPKKDAERPKIVGYDASWSASFSIDGTADAAKVHDKLSELPGAEVPRPRFALKELDQLHDAAFKAAFAQVEKRFAAQCAALALARGSYRIAGWQTHYDESESAKGRRGGRAMLASASAARPMPAPEPEEEEMVAGKATVSVNLTVSYAEDDR